MKNRIIEKPSKFWGFLLIIAIALLMTGCGTITTVTEKSFLPDGTTVSKETVTKTISGFVTTAKVVNEGSAVNALKLETTGSLTSGTPLANLVAGAGLQVMQNTPTCSKGETNAPSYIKISQTTLFDVICGNLSSSVEAYTGVAGESAAESTARLAALRGTSTTK